LPNLFVPTCPTTNQLNIISETPLLVIAIANQVRYPLLYSTCDAPVEILLIVLIPGFCDIKCAPPASHEISLDTTATLISVCSHGKLVLSTTNDRGSPSGLNHVPMVSNTISKSCTPEARVVVNGI
jgi:hypothetical protein